MSVRVPNKFAGRCVTCGCPVGARMGVVERRAAGGPWLHLCRMHAAGEGAAAAKMAPAAKVTAPDHEGLLDEWWDAGAAYAAASGESDFVFHWTTCRHTGEQAPRCADVRGQRGGDAPQRRAKISDALAMKRMQREMEL